MRLFNFVSTASHALLISTASAGRFSQPVFSNKAISSSLIPSNNDDGGNQKILRDPQVARYGRAWSLSLPIQVIPQPLPQHYFPTNNPPNKAQAPPKLPLYNQHLPRHPTAIHPRHHRHNLERPLRAIHHLRWEFPLRRKIEIQFQRLIQLPRSRNHKTHHLRASLRLREGIHRHAHPG
jgi:hypothetical protein